MKNEENLMTSDVELFYNLVKDHKNYLVPSEMVEKVVNFADSQDCIFHGGMIVNSGNYQFLYYEGE